MGSQLDRTFRPNIFTLEVPVVIAGTHFAQNLEIRLTQVKFGHYFQVPVINAGTHFAQNLEH